MVLICYEGFTVEKHSGHSLECEYLFDLFFTYIQTFVILFYSFVWLFPFSSFLCFATSHTQPDLAYEVVGVSFLKAKMIKIKNKRKKKG